MAVCPQCGESNPKVGAKCPGCEDSYYVYEQAVERANRDPYIGSKLIDKYVVVSRISEGGMGTVYRALQLPVEREVALKVLRAELEDNAEVRDRFTREARAVSSLGHPNVITLFDFGFDESDNPYMVMEYAPGESLTEWIYRDEIGLARILAVFNQMLEALDDAHEKGIVHRDLKPGNIIVTEIGPGEDFIKLLDFGIARLLNTTTGQGRGLTREGEIYGTPHYMSPEQASGSTDIGTPADVYAAGIILYEMLCRRCPFQATDPLSILLMHREEELPKLQPRSGVTVPRPLEKILWTATQKDPADRYQTAGAMLEDLTRFDDPQRSGLLHASGIENEAERVAPPRAEEKPIVDEPTGERRAEGVGSEPVADGGEPGDDETDPTEWEPVDPTPRATTPREDSVRELDPDKLAEEADGDSLGLDWERYGEHADPEKDRAGQRKGAYDGIGGRLVRFARAVAAVSAALLVALASFMVISAQFGEVGPAGGTLVGLLPVGVALFSTFAGGAKVLRGRRFVRDVLIYGGIGFVVGHFPDPGAMANRLAADPTWFLDPVDHLAFVAPLENWIASGAQFYVDVLTSIPGVSG